MAARRPQLNLLDLPDPVQDLIMELLEDDDRSATLRHLSLHMTNPQPLLDSWRVGNAECAADRVAGPCAGGALSSLRISVAGAPTEEGFELSHRALVLLPRLRRLALHSNCSLEPTGEAFVQLADLEALTSLVLDVPAAHAFVGLCLPDWGRLRHLAIPFHACLRWKGWPTTLWSGAFLSSLHLDIAFEDDRHIWAGAAGEGEAQEEEEALAHGLGLDTQLPAEIVSLAALQRLEIEGARNIAGLAPLLPLGQLSALALPACRLLSLAVQQLPELPALRRLDLHLSEHPLPLPDPWQAPGSMPAAMHPRAPSLLRQVAEAAAEGLPRLHSISLLFPPGADPRDRLYCRRDFCAGRLMMMDGGLCMASIQESGPCIIDCWQVALTVASAYFEHPGAASSAGTSTGAGSGASGSSTTLVERLSGLPVAALAARHNVTAAEVAATLTVLLEGGFKAARWAATAAATARILAQPAEVAADRVNYLHPSDWQAQRQLLRFVREQGGVARFEPQQGCPVCPRGAVASEDLQPGDFILHLPERLLISISHPADAGAIPNAGAFAEQMLLGSDLVESHLHQRCTGHQPWLRSLWLRAQPHHRRGVAFALQEPSMWGAAQRVYEWYHGGPGQRKPALEDTLRGPDLLLMNFEAFREAAAAMAVQNQARAFTFTRKHGGKRNQTEMIMTPGLDMLDYSVTFTNAEYGPGSLGTPAGQAASTPKVAVVATKHIRAGELIAMEPSPTPTGRPTPMHIGSKLALMADDGLRRLGWLSDDEPPSPPTLQDVMTAYRDIGMTGWIPGFPPSHEFTLKRWLDGMRRQVVTAPTFAEAAMDAAVTRDGRMRILKLLALHRWRTLDDFLAGLDADVARQARRDWRAGAEPEDETEQQAENY
ncbi:hypothetical protein ABPG75_002916 [Micractinium tetrahymenae]